MQSSYSWIAAALITLGAGLVSVEMPARARGEEASTTGLSAREFANNRELLLLKNQPWANIPWQVSLTEARQRAAKEHKPIFLVVNTGNCLGWT